MKGNIVSLLLLSILLTGCIETQEIEKLGLINARGVDTSEDNLLETTLVVFQFSSQSAENTQIIPGRGKTIKGAAQDAARTSVFKLAPGKNKITLFGREIAEQGIISLLDTQARDARIPDLMYLAVSDTTAKEILTVNEKKIPVDVGQFLHEAIENHTYDHNIPRKTLQDFLQIYHDIGQDNVLPLFGLVNGIPKLESAVVFKGDQLVGEITPEEAILINFMDRTLKEKLMELSLPLEPFKGYLENREERRNEENFDLTVLIQKGNSKTNLTDQENLVFQTETDLELRLVEQNAGIVLKDNRVIQLLEKEVEKKIKAEFEKLLKKLQKLESDAYGYGRYYKSSLKGKELTREEWQEKFPEIDVKFNVNAKIIRHGTKE